MGKRSDFEHRELGFYPTPYKAVKPLLPHLAPETKYCEPCAGKGDLIRHLATANHVCVAAYDVNLMVDGVTQLDASFLTLADLNQADMIITNPPWERDVLHQIISRCLAIAPAWLLFDADWMHTRQSAPYMPFCEKIVSVGRVKWIENSKDDGKDNCCWYKFNTSTVGNPTFYGRSA